LSFDQGNKNVEVMLRIALKVDDIISDAISIWKNDKKYGFLFANPSSYLNYSNGPSISNASCLSKALHSNGSGKQISSFLMLPCLRKYLDLF